MSLSSAHRVVVLVALVLGAAQGGCSSDQTEETACDRWKVAAKAYADACNPLAYPPVDDDGDVACKTDATIAKAAKAGTADSGVRKLGSLDLCADFLDRRAQDCAPWQAKAGETAYYDQYVHCTYNVVKHWDPPQGGDACARWKEIADYRSACDPSVYPVIPDGAKCVPDSAVSTLTDGRFETVAQCADYLYDLAFPCEVSLADRELCANLLAH